METYRLSHTAQEIDEKLSKVDILEEKINQSSSNTKYTYTISENGWYRIAETNSGINSYNTLLQLVGTRQPVQGEEVANNALVAISGGFGATPEILFINNTNHSGVVVEEVRVVYPEANSDGFHDNQKAYLDIKIITIKDGIDTVDLAVTVPASTGWNYYTEAENVDATVTEGFLFVKDKAANDIQKKLDTITTNLNDTQNILPEAKAYADANFTSKQIFEYEITEKFSDNSYVIAELSKDPNFGIYDILVSKINSGVSYYDRFTVLINSVKEDSTSGSDFRDSFSKNFNLNIFQYSNRVGVKLTELIKVRTDNNDYQARKNYLLLKFTDTALNNLGNDKLSIKITAYSNEGVKFLENVIADPTNEWDSDIAIKTVEETILNIADDKADKNHTHAEYALKEHDHTEYALREHDHAKYVLKAEYDETVLNRHATAINSHTASINANTLAIKKNTDSLTKLGIQLDYLSPLNITVESSYNKRTTADGEPIVGKSSTNVKKIYGDSLVLEEEVNIEFDPTDDNLRLLKKSDLPNVYPYKAGGFSDDYGFGALYSAELEPGYYRFVSNVPQDCMYQVGLMLERSNGTRQLILQDWSEDHPIDVLNDMPLPSDPTKDFYIGQSGYRAILFLYIDIIEGYSDVELDTFEFSNMEEYVTSAYKNFFRSQSSPNYSLTKYNYPVYTPTISSVKSTTYNLAPALDSMVNDYFVKNEDGSFTMTRKSGTDYLTESLPCSLSAGIEYALKYTTVAGGRIRTRFYDKKNNQISQITHSSTPNIFTLSTDCEYIKFFIPSDVGEGGTVTIRDLQITNSDKKDLPYTLPYEKSELKLYSQYQLGGFKPDWYGENPITDCREYISGTTLYKFKSEFSITGEPLKVLSSDDSSVTVEVPGSMFTMQRIEYYNNPIKFINVPQNVTWKAISDQVDYEGDPLNDVRFVFYNITLEEITSIKALVFHCEDYMWELEHEFQYPTYADLFDTLSVRKSSSSYTAYRNGQEEILGNDNAKYGVYPIIEQEYLTYAIGGIN